MPHLVSCFLIVKKVVSYMFESVLGAATETQCNCSDCAGRLGKACLEC